MPFLVLLVVAVVVVVLVMRSAGASGGHGPRLRGPSARQRFRPVRPTAPDDDPEFLRELGRRARGNDGSPT